MNRSGILCIDDQRDILAVLRKDLRGFESEYEILSCESTDEAREVLEERQAEGAAVALVICDHLMPGQNGVDFLVEINRDRRYARTGKILLTGMVSYKDAIVAVNMAGIDRYLEKPWNQDELVRAVRDLLRDFKAGSET